MYVWGTLQNAVVTGLVVAMLQGLMKKSVTPTWQYPLPGELRSGDLPVHTKHNTVTNTQVKDTAIFGWLTPSQDPIGTIY